MMEEWRRQNTSVSYLPSASEPNTRSNQSRFVKSLAEVIDVDQGSLINSQQNNVSLASLGMGCWSQKRNIMNGRVIGLSSTSLSNVFPGIET